MNESGIGAERRPDVDWLRIGATYLLFVFHGVMIFNPSPFFHVRNAETSTVMFIVAGFISLWHMPLFFLLAGWSVAASLRLRGAAEFVGERVRKLAIPLVIGCVTIGPVLKYLELRGGLDMSHTGLRVSADLQGEFQRLIPGGLPELPAFDETFLEFLPTFFAGLDRFTWGHLWFVAYLFTFSLIYLPAMVLILRRRGAGAEARPLHVYAPLLVLIGVQVGLRPYWPGIQNLYDDWANFAYYSTYLFAGFFLARSPQLERVLHGERRRALAIALAATAVLLAGVLGAFESEPVMLAGSAVAGWCYVVAILGYARRMLSHDGPTLRYLRESAFPVYILHQLALVLVGYFVVQLPLGIATKFVLVVGCAAAATLVFYHFVVRNVGVLRFAYGMKPLAAAPRFGALRASTGAVLVAATALAATPAAVSGAAAAGDPRGVWWAEGGAARVEIRDCGDALCGRVVWLRSPFGRDGCPLLDEHNPRADLRQTPVLGMDILTDLRPERGERGRWVDGRVYDPGSGSTYRCTLEVDADRIELRGYIGLPIIGRTSTWHRFGAGARVCGR